MGVELAFDHFVGCLDDGGADLGVKLSQRHVGLGGGALDNAQRAHDRQGLLFQADLEIAQRALRLRAPILVGSHFDRTKGIGFNACFGHGFRLRGCRGSGRFGTGRAGQRCFDGLELRAGIWTLRVFGLLAPAKHRPLLTIRVCP